MTASSALVRRDAKRSAFLKRSEKRSAIASRLTSADARIERKMGPARLWFFAIAVPLGMLCVRASVSAHRLDEYLQATTIDIGKSRFALEIRLTPGVDVFSRVMAKIDTNGDRLISEAEQRAYAKLVLHDLSLSIDGKQLHLRLTSLTFPKIEQMKEGLGEIVFDYEALVPAGSAHRKILFENHHQSAISVYLANCLFPKDPDIRITAQSRNYEQTVYRVDYTQAIAPAPAIASSSGSSVRNWLIADAIILLPSLAFLRQRRRRAIQKDAAGVRSNAI